MDDAKRRDMNKSSLILQAIDMVIQPKAGKAYTGLFGIQSIIDHVRDIYKQECSKKQVYQVIRRLRRQGHRMAYCSGRYQYDDLP